LVHGNRLYVHFGRLGTACLDLTGNVVWRNTSVDYVPVHGGGGSPILADNLLVFSCDGADKAFIVALDVKSGDLAWRTDRSVPAERRFSFTTPLLIEVNGQKQIISPASDAVYAYEPSTGLEIWHVRYRGYSVIPRPVYGHGLVFLSTGFDSPSVLAIRPDGQGDVTDTHVAWTLKRGAPNTPSLVLVGDELYMVSDGGFASCVDARTGKVHWYERIGGNHSASPIVADGKLYCQSEEGVGIVVKASKEFQQLAKNALNERTLASVAAIDGGLLIRTENNLYRFQSSK
jgi:outer membrane protein assembly factor BamB